MRNEAQTLGDDSRSQRLRHTDTEILPTSQRTQGRRRPFLMERKLYKQRPIIYSWFAVGFPVTHAGRWGDTHILAVK